MTAIARPATLARMLWQMLRGQPKPATDESGVVALRELRVPLSHYMSQEAREAAIKMMRQPPRLKMSSIEALRSSTDELYFAPMLERMRERFAVTVEDQTIAGTRCTVVTPATAVRDDRLLINLHGGGFMLGSGLGQLIEAIPVAALTKTKVVSIDFRQSPECRLPQTVEEVLRVYRELIKTHAPERIGLYGCSAGGLLSAIVISHLLEQRLPLPAALGMLCCSGDLAWEGDSRFIAPALCGQAPPGVVSDPLLMARDYLAGVDAAQPAYSPMSSPERLAAFPPTLLVTGTRSFELGGAVNTHRQFVAAGVDARLHVWDGMWHGFLYEPSLPESREAYDVVAAFFERTLQDIGGSPA